MSATSNASNELAKTLVTSAQITKYWILFFRHGMNAALSKNFYHDGDLQSAVRRAQEHCKIMGYRYIWLRPLICNIEEEEEAKLKGYSSTTSLGEL